MFNLFLVLILCENTISPLITSHLYTKTTHEIAKLTELVNKAETS